MGRDLAQYQQVVDREVDELTRRVRPVSRLWGQLRELTEGLAGRLPRRTVDGREEREERGEAEAVANGAEAGPSDVSEQPDTQEPAPAAAPAAPTARPGTADDSDPSEGR